MKAKPSQINRKDTYDHDKCAMSGCPDQWLEGLSEALKHGELAGVAYYCGLLWLPFVSKEQCRKALALIANDKLSSKHKVTGAPPARPWRQGNAIEKSSDQAGYEAALVCFRLLNKPRQLTNSDFQLLHYYLKTKAEFTDRELNHDLAEMSESQLWEKGYFERVSNPEARQRAVENLKPEVRPYWERLLTLESAEAQSDGIKVLELLFGGSGRNKVVDESVFEDEIHEIFGRPNENGRFTQDVKRHSRA